MSDVWRNDRVSQELSLRKEPTAFSAFLRVRSSRCSFCANSASVSSALVPSAAGRCNGMPKAESPDQIACRSGSPQGVRGAEYGAWANAGDAAIRTSPHPTQHAMQRRIVTSSAQSLQEVDA